MERWALVSGLNGDLDLYERIQLDLKRQRDVASLFVLGDLVGACTSCNALLDRLRRPKPGDLTPECVYGWRDDQLLAECGYRGERKADALRQNEGEASLANLLAAVDPDHLGWLASLQFGFIELDCALIHGSSADVADRLTETTSPLILMDRLTRLDVNRLFTARSGHQFRLELTGGEIRSKVTDHSGEHQAAQAVPKRSVIGIGQGDHYTLYDPATDHLTFLDLSKSRGQRKRGFG
ncbi:MAG: phosphoesterase [Cyanobacteriota bacterium]|nr:phosphoesterase [Cyanobacteriota bacterium]